MASDTPDRQLGWLVLAIVVALFVLPVVVMGFWMMGTGPMMGGGSGHGTWGMGAGTAGWLFVAGVAFQLLFLALLVGGGFLGYRLLTSESESTDPAIEELRSAYARGELDDEEFERRRDRLESDR